MKFLKWLVIILASVVILVLVASLLVSKDSDITRTATINAPASVVFGNVADFSKWNEWSAWKEMDPESVQTLFGETGQSGSGYSWKGEKSGEGKQTATAIVPNQEVSTDLQFTKPFNAEAKSSLKFTEENGVTTVSWNYKAHHTMPMNLMMAMFKGEMVKSLDRGLEKLKALSEKAAAAGPAYNVQQTSLPTTSYLMVRKKMKWSEISSQFFMESYKKVGEAGGAAKLQMAGAPVGLVFEWNKEAQTTDMAAAIPYNKTTAGKGDVTPYTLDSTRAIVVDYYGAYEKMEGAYGALENYATANNLKIKYPSIEQYVTDPGTEPDTAKWLTKIYFGIE